MKDALATAGYWAPLLETIADIAFAVVIVALAVELVSGRIAKRFERKIESARELKIAKLNNETARLRQFIVKAGTPRIPDQEKLLTELKNARKAIVSIEYARQVPDARQCARLLWEILKGAGWPMGQRDGPAPFEELPVGPPLGIAVLANHESMDRDDPVNALALAIDAAVEPPVTGGVLKTLPDNTVRIIVGFRSFMTPAAAH